MLGWFKSSSKQDREKTWEEMSQTERFEQTMRESREAREESKRLSERTNVAIEKIRRELERKNRHPDANLICLHSTNSRDDTAIATSLN